MAIFGREVIGREVVDRTGVQLGSLTDIHFDLKTGSISELIVTVEPSVSASALPFESHENTVIIPADAVSRIATQIHLNK
ncbi:MAG TPA: PRC-barrel domain-containing protein [Poseidonia sp.]|nr:PRC-barrel domain-containing protein [Poseidonia sp.]